MIKIEMKGFDELKGRLQRMARNVETTTGRLNRTMVSTPLTLLVLEDSKGGALSW